MNPLAPLLNDLRNEARDNLQVKAEITAKAGTVINIGEKFKARFRITNYFAGSNGESPGHAHFRKVELHVFATAFAKPTSGTQVTLPVTDHLGYGSTATTTEIEFEALANLPMFFGHDLPEVFARVRVEADFDVARFFHIVQDQSVYTQIVDT